MPTSSMPRARARGRHAHLLHQTLPMPLAHGGVAQVADERHQLLQVVDALLEALDHLVGVRVRVRVRVYGWG